MLFCYDHFVLVEIFRVERFKISLSDIVHFIRPYSSLIQEYFISKNHLKRKIVEVPSFPQLRCCNLFDLISSQELANGGANDQDEDLR